MGATITTVDSPPPGLQKPFQTNSITTIRPPATPPATTPTTVKFRTPSILAALGILFTCGTASATTVIVAENFGGLSSANLSGSTADIFDPAITTASGSATWSGSAIFKQDGSVILSTSGARSIHLNMGSYINDAKGTTTGLFQLAATLARPSGDYVALGFSSLNSPGATTTYLGNGLGTMVYRSNGDIDQFAITGGSEVAADDVLFTGDRTLTITLDLRGWNGTTNFGTVSFADSVAGTFGSFDYTSNVNFNSILLSAGNNTTGAVSALTLTQIPEPAAALLGSLGLLALLRRRRA